MIEFEKGNLSPEDAFWVMWYFLMANYELSNGNFDLSDILSASEPIEFNENGHVDGKELGNRKKAPIDSGMTHMWNDALEKFKNEGIPPTKQFIN